MLTRTGGQSTVTAVEAKRKWTRNSLLDVVLTVASVKEGLNYRTGQGGDTLWCCKRQEGKLAQMVRK